MTCNKITPVVPDHIDCNSYNAKHKIAVIGISRAALSLISFCLCFTYILVYHKICLGERYVLIAICVINVFHSLISLHLIFKSRTNKISNLKWWLVADFIFTMMFVFLVMELIFIYYIAEEHLFIHAALAVKLIALSVFLSYRFGMNYIELLETSHECESL